MTRVDALIDRAIRDGARCEPPSGVPPLDLPDDLRAFLERCGGLRFPSGIVVGAPDRLVRAAPIALGRDVEVPDGDPTAATYVIADTGPEGTAVRVLIDLAADRRGRCYDGFWDVFGVAGSMPVVAASFTDLLERLVAVPADLFWELPDFEPLGDAYG